jgi:hypothetical protein
VSYHRSPLFSVYLEAEDGQFKLNGANPLHRLEHAFLQGFIICSVHVASLEISQGDMQVIIWQHGLNSFDMNG